MGYALESQDEFERLNEQAKMHGYSCEEEFQHLKIEPNTSILEIGCGSGIVGSYLAEKFKKCSITAVDLSEHRVNSANTKYSSMKNLSFEVQDVSKLNFKNSSFDLIVSRYLIQHLPENIRIKAFEEAYRCLKPEGQFYFIDFDHAIFPLYPQSEELSALLKKFEKKCGFDLTVGRKLPFLAHSAGFKDITWTVQTIEFQGKNLEGEVEMMRQRFKVMAPLLYEVFGSLSDARKLSDLYLKAMREPGAVVYYTKLIVQGRK